MTLLEEACCAVNSLCKSVCRKSSVSFRQPAHQDIQWHSVPPGCEMLGVQKVGQPQLPPFAQLPPSTSVQRCQRWHVAVWRDKCILSCADQRWQVWLAQGRCFSDCNFCYVLSLGFVLACGYAENSLPNLFLQTHMPTWANCACLQNL